MSPEEVDKLHWNTLETRWHAGLRLWFLDAIEPGSFLMACLCNDLRLASAHADPGAWASVQELLNWLYFEAPPGSHGSKDAVRRWKAGVIRG